MTYSDAMHLIIYNYKDYGVSRIKYANLHNNKYIRCKKSDAKLIFIA